MAEQSRPRGGTVCSAARLRCDTSAEEQRTLIREPEGLEWREELLRPVRLDRCERSDGECDLLRNSQAQQLQRPQLALHNSS